MPGHVAGMKPEMGIPSAVEREWQPRILLTLFRSREYTHARRRTVDLLGEGLAGM